MLSSLKRLTKHSAVYGIGHIVTRLVNVMLLPLYTNRLSPAEFGASAVLYSFLAVMIIIYTIGIDAAFLRYFILNDDENKRRQIFSTAYWVILAASIIFSGLLYLFSNQTSFALISEGNYGDLVGLSSLILLFDALAILPFLFLRAQERSVFYIILKFTNVLINVGLNIYFIVYAGMGVKGMFLANVWASGVTLLMLLPILLRQLTFQFVAGHLKALLKFGLPFLPSTLAVVLLDLIDRPLMERLAGLEATGIYNASVKIGLIMALMVGGFRFAWHPFFLSTSKQENAKDVFSKVLTYFTSLNLFVFLAVSLFIDEIARFDLFGFSLIGPEYRDGLGVVPLILLSYVFYGMYVNFIVGVYLEEKTKYLPIITFAGVAVNVVVNLFLIPAYGVIGAGWARLFGHLIMAMMLLFFAQRFYRISYEFGRLLKLGILTAVCFAIGYTAHGAWEVAVKFGLLLAMPVVLYFTGFFEARELNALRGFLRPRSNN